MLKIYKYTHILFVLFGLLSPEWQKCCLRSPQPISIYIYKFANTHFSRARLSKPKVDKLKLSCCSDCVGFMICTCAARVYKFIVLGLTLLAAHKTTKAYSYTKNICLIFFN